MPTSRLIASMGMFGIVVAGLVTSLGGCLERRAAVPTDIPRIDDSVQILLYRPSDLSLGSGTAVVSINGAEVASLESTQHKIITVPPGNMEISVTGGLRPGRYVATFTGAKGKVYRLAVRGSGESFTRGAPGEPRLNVIQSDGSFKIEKL